jgi:hypothetical protein
MAQGPINPTRPHLEDTTDPSSKAGGDRKEGEVVNIAATVSRLDLVTELGWLHPDLARAPPVPPDQPCVASTPYTRPTV